MASTITQRRTRARRLYTGEPHATALNEVRRHADVLPAASTRAQQDLEMRVLAALVSDFGVHCPGDDGPFALRWVGPREDSLVLAAAEAHRERVMRSLLAAGGADAVQGAPPGPGQKWITLAGPSGGTLLLPRDHGPALRRAVEELA
ncbi:hypothetical protein EEJ42_02200, partial [Streptomyces botrytidirepellens]